MKAIIIAAGLGSRLQHLTDDLPKCMLPIAGRTILQRQLDVYRNLGIDEISIIRGYQAEKISCPGINYFFNDDFRNNNILASLFYAEEMLSGDVIVSYSDILFEQSVVESLIATDGDICAVVDRDWQASYVGRQDHPLDEAEKVSAEAGCITQMGKHLGVDVASGEFIGMAMFRAAGTERLKQVYHEKLQGGTEQPFQHASAFRVAYLTDILQELIDQGDVISPTWIDGGWREIDTIEDYRRAEAQLAARDETSGYLRAEWVRQGRHFRTMLNDLKRRPEDAARELDVPIELISSILAGEQALPSWLATRAAQTWPVSAGDFFIKRDDCPHGFSIMRAEASSQSRRVMMRAGQPYYEYRDTAMSSVAPFRPEWIKELCVVDDDDPANSLVQWNHGHFMHQFTYFVGPVNFYYQGDDGEKKVAVMNTGDTMYITPFVPHSFATRRNQQGQSGLILALTYGNHVAGEAKQELSAIGEQLSSDYALDFSAPESAQAELLRFHRVAASLTMAELADRTDIAEGLLQTFESGEWSADLTQLQQIATGLHVSLRDLLPPDGPYQKVVVQAHADGRRWPYPESRPRYEMVELAGTQMLPHSKALEIHVEDDSPGPPDLTVGLHQYGYNVGDQPLSIHWHTDNGQRTETVGPGDSFYLKPFVPHAFRGQGSLLVLRIGGSIVGDAQLELSAIGRHEMGRVVGESAAWFNKSGQKKVA
jgi:methylphosphonate synthase